MRNPPSISVVIPVRNRAHAIGACIASALAQSSPPAEVIVVDDGSDDDTTAAAAGFERTRVVRNTRRPGAQGARNTGIVEARGNWIAFLDSDDTWHPGKLERQLAALAGVDDPGRYVVHGDGVELDADGTTTRPIAIPHLEGDAYRALLLRPGPLFPCLLVPRAMLFGIGLLDEACPSYQEWDTSIRLAEVARFIHVRSPLFRWHRHAGTSISKDAARDFLGYRYVVEKHGRAVASVHGERALRGLQANLLVHGLRLARFDDVLAVEPPRRVNLAFPLARACATLQACPPGAPTLLRMAALA